MCVLYVRSVRLCTYIRIYANNPYLTIGYAKVQIFAEKMFPSQILNKYSLDRFIFPCGTIYITFTKPFTSQNNILQQFGNFVPDLFPLWLRCLNLSNRCYFIGDIE